MIYLVVVCHFLQYLKGISSRGLFFLSERSLYLVGFSDPNWVGCVDTCHFIVG
jgi:hypothetical protein